MRHFSPTYKTERFIGYLDRNPDVGLVYGDAIWHRHLKGEEELANCNMSLDYGPMVMKHRNIIRTPTVLHRREVIDKVGWFKPIKVRVPHPDTPYVGIEDWDYWVRISKHFKVKHHPVMVAHKINETSDHYWDPNFDPEFDPAFADQGGFLGQAANIKEYEILVKRFTSVEGYLENGVGYTLMMAAAQGYGRGEVVEIGSFLGRSTCWLAWGCQQAGREKITAVDHFKGSKEHQPGKRFACSAIEKEGTTYHQFIRNLKSQGLEDYVTPIQSDSYITAKAWNKPIRLLFIDGNHAYEATRSDFEAFSPYVISGGYIGFHDVDGWPGVTQFYDELMETTNQYQEIFSIDSLRLVQKIY